ncbi:IclR family transcriptional regulator [Actinomadura sp. LOL_016]|uniref:IclR family transcriptional regulator n=1 Tax=unclassified Actinomadura TaxID=2626254 RepID=UPI003A80BA2D
MGKALRLLAAFQGVSPPLGVSELARRSGLPKSTAFRFLADLEEAGFVERDGSDYRLGLSLFELGSRVLICRPNGLRDIAMHHMSELHVRTGLNVHLGVLEGGEVVHIAKVNRGLQSVRVHFQPGSRIAASCSALGKVLLAFGEEYGVRRVVEAGLPRRTKYSITEPARLLRELAKVREQGIAFENEETAAGVAGIAAPIMHDGEAIAALSVSLQAPTTDGPRIARFVRAAANQIAREHETWASEVW